MERTTRDDTPLVLPETYRFTLGEERTFPGCLGVFGLGWMAVESIPGLDLWLSDQWSGWAGAAFGFGVSTLLMHWMPRKYVFLRDSLWRAAGPVRKLRPVYLSNAGTMLCAASDVQSWASTRWRGLPAIEITLRDGRIVTLCYPAGPRTGRTEHEVFLRLDAWVREARELEAEEADPGFEWDVEVPEEVRRYI